METPSPGLLAELSGAVTDIPAELPIASAGRDILACLAGSDLESVRAILAPEFTRLLRGLGEGLGPAPPYESLYRGDALLGPPLQAVTRRYAAAGFADIAPEAGPQDHVGVEFRFLSLLCFREMEAWQAEDSGAALLWREQQTDFLSEHLLGWLPGLVSEVERCAKADFYPAAMRLAEAFVRQEADALKQADQAAWVA